MVNIHFMVRSDANYRLSVHPHGERRCLRSSGPSLTHIHKFLLLLACQPLCDHLHWWRIDYGRASYSFFGQVLIIIKARHVPVTPSLPQFLFPTEQQHLATQSVVHHLALVNSSCLLKVQGLWPLPKWLYLSFCILTNS